MRITKKKMMTMVRMVRKGEDRGDDGGGGGDDDDDNDDTDVDTDTEDDTRH